AQPVAENELTIRPPTITNLRRPAVITQRTMKLRTPPISDNRRTTRSCPKSHKSAKPFSKRKGPHRLLPRWAGKRGQNDPPTPTTQVRPTTVTPRYILHHC